MFLPYIRAKISKSEGKISFALGRLSGQAKPERKERVIVSISNIHGKLIHRLEPSPRKLSCKSIISEEDICNTLSFSSREPCSHESIHQWNIRLKDDWTA